MTYFLYCRKSTDVEDKQVRSIDDQLVVLRRLAKTEGLTIVQEFIEKQSAKIPGRPVFDEMLTRIEQGEAQGIISWKLDRLARNPVDGGQISWFLQRGIIEHIQTHDKSYRPTDNILMMSIEFGMANQFIIDLRANVKRGLYEKARRGNFPGLAPLGYFNDPRIKLVAVDKKKSKIVRRAFELYAEGTSRLEDVADFLAQEGIITKGGKPIKKDQVKYMLSNPFYVGFFRYAGELYEGTHEPIMTKKLFDTVQAVMKERSKPQKSPINSPQALCGTIRCGSCGMMITAEQKTKYQKNGNVHNYVYYRCTRKSKTIKCNEKPIREEELNRQLSTLLKEYALPNEWADTLLEMANKDEQEANRSIIGHSLDMQREIQAISQKLQRLLDAYLEQDIERDTYLSQKKELLSQKKSLEEKIRDFERGSVAWIEPLREWIKDAQILNTMPESTPLVFKKSWAQKIFGLNLILSDRTPCGTPQIQWAAVRAAHCETDKTPLCNNMVPEVGVEPTTKGL